MTVTDTETTLGRRVTPTGRLVLPSTAAREEWLAARRRGIGSSDIPRLLMLVEKKGTPSHVYYDKIGELPEEDADEYMFWGNQHEDTVARVWAMRNRSAVRRVGLVAQDGAPWRMCTLDRRVTVCPLSRSAVESCALEIKTRSAFLAGKWRREVPDDVLVQILWQIIVTGYDHIHGAVLIGGNDYRQFTVRRSDYESLIADLIAGADRVWREHVVPRRPPRPAGSPDALVELYDVLHPQREGVARLDRNLDAFDAVQEYLEAGAAEKAAVERKKAAKAQLVAALGGNEVGAMGDDIVCTYKAPRPKDEADLDRLAERWPDAYDDCVRKSEPSRRFEITNAFRKKWSTSA